MEWYLSLSVGAALAVCAGLRAFLPLFAVGAIASLGLFPWVKPHPAFLWVASPPAIAAFAAAAMAEILWDKSPEPAVAGDLAFLVLRPAAGVLGIMAVVDLGQPAATVGAAVALAAVLSVPLHLLKAGAHSDARKAKAVRFPRRYSLYEDALALTGSVLALVIPAVAFPVNLVAAFWLLLRTRSEVTLRVQQARDRGRPYRLSK